MSVVIQQLEPEDVSTMEALSDVFGEAFEQRATYCHNRPSRDYLRKLLAGDTFIALAALKDNKVIGGVAAYELHKFELERSEIYLYDLAVLTEYRRNGVATALIEKLKQLAFQALKSDSIMFLGIT